MARQLVEERLAFIEMLALWQGEVRNCEGSAAVGKSSRFVHCRTGSSECSHSRWQENTVNFYVHFRCV